MNEIISYIESNVPVYLEELKEYLSIQSISTLPEKKKDMTACAKFVKNKLKKAGMKRTEIFKTAGHPIVYGEWISGKNKPTVLIYGHYDVQPVDPLDEWNTPPFEGVVKDGQIWARGANDNKGQHFVHVKSVEAFFKNKKTPPVNIKFLIEGEEEIGSESLEKFLKENKKLLKCDAVLISDTSLYAEGIPTINYGLRGLAFLEVEVTGPNRDLHSGSFGGAIANPINVLAQMIAKLHDRNGKVTIPNFYKEALPLTKKEKKNIEGLKFSDKKFAKEYGVRELQGEKNFGTLARLWARPTLDCNGIWGGFIDKGAKTVLPSKATAKISMRLVPNQDPKIIAKEFTKYIRSLAPKSVKVKITPMHNGSGLIIPLDDAAIKAAASATSKAFGKKTVFTREGGSIPIVVEFVKQLKAPTILMGLGLDSDNIHSPNEHFSIDSFRKGMLSSAYFFEEFAKINN